MMFIKLFQERYGLRVQMDVARNISTVQIYYDIRKMNAVLNHNLNVHFVQKPILRMLV